MTTTPTDPAMSLKETKEVLREEISICDLNIRICDENLYDEEAALLRRHRGAYESALHHLEQGKQRCRCDMLKNYAHCALGGVFLGELEDAVHFCPWCGGTLTTQPSQQEKP